MVYTVCNEIFSSNTYILTEEQSKKCIVIDPGLSGDLIDGFIIENKLAPVGIISTHGHFDHIGSAELFKVKYKIPFFLHIKDKKISQAANFYLKVVKVKHTIITPVITNLLEKNYEEIVIDNFKFEIFNLEGHTDGSCVIKYQNSLFTGDLLYANYIISNNFPGENIKKLKVSIKYLFENFSPEFIIYPGHGKSEMLGIIYNNNKDLKRFLADE